jgi:hypothetical protein
MSRYPRHKQRASTTLSGEITRVSAKAILFEPSEGGDAFWIPRAVCQDGDGLDEGDGDLVVEKWWLRKEGRL